MIRFVSNFTSQLQEAYEIGCNLDFKSPKKAISNVIICGLGGSGIGGNIVSQLASTYSELPSTTHNDYGLPNFVDDKSLVIISSYSGNTEETLSAMRLAIKRNCEVACITSGGEVKKIAEENNFNISIVPGGNPPRAMLTYSLIQLIFFFEKLELISKNSTKEILSAIDLLKKEEGNIKSIAKDTAEKIQKTTPLIYSEANFEAVGTRFKQQLNENAKILAFDHVVPEMNHNELVGWAGGNNNFSAIFLRNDSDYDRNKVRMNICKEIISKKTKHIFELYSKGNTAIKRTLYLILLTDWISVYLAEILGVDSIEVDVITNLKNQLSKH